MRGSPRIFAVAGISALVLSVAVLLSESGLLMDLISVTTTQINTDHGNQTTVGHLRLQENKAQMEETVLKTTTSESSTGTEWIQVYPATVDTNASVFSLSLTKDLPNTGTMNMNMSAIWIDKNNPQRCFRRCPNGFSNQIVHQMLPMAGLNDRKHVIRHLVDLGGYLCATIWVKGPYFTLHVKHTEDGQKLSRGLKWDEFLKVASHIDDEHIQEPVPLREYEKIYRGDEKTIQIQPRWPVDTPRVVWNRTHVEFVNTQDVSKMVEHFRTVQSIEFESGSPSTSTSSSPSRKSMSFVWLLGEGFYPLYPPLAKYIENKMRGDSNPRSDGTDSDSLPPPKLLPWHHEACQYASIRPPDRLQRLKKEFWNDVLLPIIQQQAQTYFSNGDDDNKKILSSLVIGSWHLRRGDSTETCDTSIPRMTKYIQCTFFDRMLQKPSRLDFQQQTPPPLLVAVLLFSDERSPTYRQELLDIFTSSSNNSNTNTAPGSSPAAVLAIWLDELVDDFFKQQIELGKLPSRYQNNYHTFELLQEIQHSEHVQFRLQHRRQDSCPDCDNLQNKIE